MSNLLYFRGANPPTLGQFENVVIGGGHQSSDAITLNVALIYYPANNSVHKLWLTVLGRDTANDGYCWVGEFNLSIVTSSSVPVILGNNSPINVQTNGLGSTYVGPSVIVSGTSIEVIVQGAAATVVNWYVFADIISIT